MISLRPDHDEQHYNRILIVQISSRQSDFDLWATSITLYMRRVEILQ